MGEFSNFCGKTSTQMEKTVRKTNVDLSVTENTNASEYTAQSNSIFAFAFDNISSSSSFWDLWMNFASAVNF